MTKRLLYQSGVYTIDFKLGRIGSHGPDNLARIDYVLPPYGFDWVPEQNLTPLDSEYYHCLLEAHKELETL